MNELQQTETVDHRKVEIWYQERIKLINEFRQRVDLYLIRTVPVLVSANLERQPEGSCFSVHTRTSMKSSTSSAKVILAERKVKLAVDKKFFEQTAELEQQLKRLKMAIDEEENDILEKELVRIDCNQEDQVPYEP